MRKYLTMARMGIMESLHFRLGMFVLVVGNILYLTLIYYLWKAVYASSGTDVVNGLTFKDTLIYLVLASALYSFMEMYTVWEIGRNIQSGKIVLDLLKPIEYQSYLFWSFSGSLIVHFVCVFLPTFVIVFIVTKGGIPTGMNLVYFMISVVMGVVINFCIDYIVGTICLFTESIWGINIMRQVIVLLLSGVTIPIAFFPEPFRTAVYYLPFQAVYNTPLKILLTATPTFETTGMMMLVQLFWCAVMLIISRLFWLVSLRQITVNGG